MHVLQVAICSSASSSCPILHTKHKNKHITERSNKQFPVRNAAASCSIEALIDFETFQNEFESIGVYSWHQMAAQVSMGYRRLSRPFKLRFSPHVLSLGIFIQFPTALPLQQDLTHWIVGSWRSSHFFPFLSAEMGHLLWPVSAWRRCRRQLCAVATLQSVIE